MPIYQYRREDGTTFEMRQSFAEDALEFDPKTGQRVHRVIQPSGIIFKGSGFYVTDNKGSSRVTPNGNGNNNGSTENGASANGAGESKSENKTETKAETKSEAKAEAKSEKSKVADSAAS